MIEQIYLLKKEDTRLYKINKVSIIFYSKRITMLFMLIMSTVTQF